jgi:hypothetical protein
MASSGYSQGDQIGRIFASWESVHFGKFLLNYNIGTYVLATFFVKESCKLIATKWIR